MNDLRPTDDRRPPHDLGPLADALPRLAPEAARASQAAFTQVRRLLPSCNLVDMTAGVLIGGAVGGTTTSLIREVITPAMGQLTALATGAPAGGAIQWVAFAGSLANCGLVTGIAALGLAAYRRVVPPPPGTTQVCRYCLSEVPAQALRCRYCTSDLALTATIPAAPAPAHAE